MEQKIKIFYEFYQYSQLNSVIIKFKLVNLIVKQQSICMDQLEQKVRRSSRLKDSSAFREFLAYASMVRDQDQVFAYMEQNQIGIQEPEFWAAKLNLLKNKCQYKQFIKTVKQINRNHELKNHPKYWLITQIQNQLERYLQKTLRKKIKGKRTAKQYEVLNYADVQKETRKFGKIQVYIDPDCRMQYRLQDLIQFVTTRLSQQCQMQKNIYERQISHRPLSFLGKNRDRIEKISQQMLGFASRPNRFSNKRVTQGRMSIVGRQSNKVDGQLVQTPDFKKKSFSKQNKQNYKIEKQKINLLDSFEILKMAVKSKGSNKKQRSQSQNPEFDIISRISSVKKQKMRNSPHKQNKDQIFSQPDLQFDRDSIYSFGESSKNPSSEPRKSKNRSSSKKKKQLKNIFKIQKHTISVNQSSKDFAFLEDTQQQDSNGLNGKNSKESLDLENVIKQIQMQKYDSQTMSEIDSNKQNNTLTGEQDLNFNEEQIRGNKQRERRKFQTLKKDRQVSIKIKNTKKSRDEESKTNQMDQSSQVIYKQLLDYLDDKNDSEPRLSLSQNERKKKNRISRISEQRSYSFSETRAKSRNNS